MKNIYLFVLGLLALSAMPARAQTDSFVVDGVYRSYIVHLPAGYSASNSYPLVLNLHAYLLDGAEEEQYTQMDASADANGYIVVYPNGIGNYWNSWGPPGATYGADDVKFLSELIDTLSAHYSVNPLRVYSCGFSNGAYMTYTLAYNIAGRLAAVASVSGTVSDNTLADYTVSRRLPVLDIQGTADPVVGYSSPANSIGVEQTVALWVDTDACTPTSDTTDLPNTSTADSSTVQLIAYQNCPAGNEVLFYKVINGGHTWPGALIPDPANGNTNEDISATDVIWTFFSRHTLTWPAGVHEISTDIPIHISPDPALDHLTISTGREVLGTDIYDLSGRKIMSSGGTKVIDIEKLSAGMYLAVISTQGEQASTTCRFIKQ